MLVSVGPVQYRIAAHCEEGRWVATALREGSLERFGPDVTGETEAEATERLAKWLAWQHAHAAALTALQEAERTYHREVAAGAAAAVSPSELDDLRRAHLENMQNARARLDLVRARRPE
jgi:hypothetical protein